MRLSEWHAKRLREDPGYAAAVAEVDLAEKFADLVIARRVELGLTQKALADAAGTTQPRISEIEAGECNVTLDTLSRVLGALSLDIDIVRRSEVTALTSFVGGTKGGFRVTAKQASEVATSLGLGANVSLANTRVGRAA